MISAFGMFNALVMSYSRLPLAMAQDGMLPGVFSKLHKKSQAPWVAILVLRGRVGDVPRPRLRQTGDARHSALRLSASYWSSWRWSSFASASLIWLVPFGFREDGWESSPSAYRRCYCSVSLDSPRSGAIRPGMAYESGGVLHGPDRGGLCRVRGKLRIETWRMVGQT